MKATKEKTSNKYFCIQMDANLKNDFLDFCNSSGLTVSGAICMLAKATVDQQKIPFEVGPLEMYAKAVKHKPNENEEPIPSARLTIRMDRELQNKLAEVCDKIGIKRSVLVRIFFMQCLNDNQLPF